MNNKVNCAVENGEKGVNTKQSVGLPRKKAEEENEIFLGFLIEYLELRNDDY